MIERLGGGTFGEVYRAWDRQLEREVALKLLRVDEATDDPLTSRIATEGRLLARVRHPNVVTVHGVAVHDGRVGLWMELVRGATLEQLLLKHGPFSAREAALVGIDLCRALAAIHAAGLIHRDVKAQNVMREDGGRIVLMDLGTGREIDPAGVRRAVPDLAGTPLYLAPEIFTGAPASERTDLYSLGVLLYHLVTGSFPVRATTIEELQAGHAQGTAVRLRDARADLPTAFVRVVDRAIAADPARRYASAGALEAELADALTDTTAAAAVVPVAQTPRSTGTWRRAGLAAATLAALLALAVVGWPSLRERRALAATAGTIRSIAVLPLVNLSGDPSQDYFADAMTEELIDDLARIRELRVISRTSVMQFKGTKKSLREVAASLNVDAVLEGSVVRFGDRVRISADLVHVASDRHVWVERYERDVRDVLTLQSDVARTIVSQVQIQLTPLEQAGFGGGRTVAPSAQEAYFQGRYYWNKRTNEAMGTALEFFKQAIAIDPSFARAYAGEADVYNLLPGNLSPFTAYPMAKIAAAKALQIDPALAEAHTSLAFAQFIFDHDYPGAEAAFRRAIELNPGYATAHQWLGDLLSATGRLDEARAEVEKARALDPLSTAVRTDIGNLLLWTRQYDEAIVELRASVAMEPNNWAAYLYLAYSHELKGMFAEAAADVRQGLRIGPSGTLYSELGRLAALTGDRAEALKIISELKQQSTERRIAKEPIALIYAALGDTDSAFQFLQQAEREGTPRILWAKVDPLFDSLRGDPRFSAMLRRLRLSN